MSATHLACACCVAASAAARCLAASAAARARFLRTQRWTSVAHCVCTSCRAAYLRQDAWFLAASKMPFASRRAILCKDARWIFLAIFAIFFLSRDRRQQDCMTGTANRCRILLILTNARASAPRHVACTTTAAAHGSPFHLLPASSFFMQAARSRLSCHSERCRRAASITRWCARSFL